MEHVIAEPAQALELGLRWREGVRALGPAFYTALQPTPLPSPYLVALNDSLSRELGLEPRLLASSSGVAAFTGNQPIPGSVPIATVYSGHQFGVWAGQLGDGRAILLGEADTAVGPREFQLKGSGRTPYS